MTNETLNGNPVPIKKPHGKPKATFKPAPILTPRKESIKSKRGRRNKQRGGENERRLARIINRWWTPNLPKKLNKQSWYAIKGSDWEFRKSPGSGGTDKLNHPGDISKPQDCPFVFEAKYRYEVPTTDSLLAAQNSLLKRWLITEEQKLATYISSPIAIPMIWLLFRKRGTKTDFLLMRAATFNWITQHTEVKTTLRYLELRTLNISRFIVFSLSEFLSSVCSKGLHWYANK